MLKKTLFDHLKAKKECKVYKIRISTTSSTVYRYSKYRHLLFLSSLEQKISRLSRSGFSLCLSYSDFSWNCSGMKIAGHRDKLLDPKSPRFSTSAQKVENGKETPSVVYVAKCRKETRNERELEN